MEKRKLPSKQAMDNFARTLAPYMAEILAQEKREGQYKGDHNGTEIDTKRKTLLKKRRS
ncbi:hypothetical protein [Fictibacillus phosphorivorans]|uniref:hypothetical protein n=1 Tax=Fictibacillus phosphorivorans TaxID=1221500 RepID=UPI0012E76492|nr:hypothetical protein [Fictibacillus phosphorivorans]